MCEAVDEFEAYVARGSSEKILFKKDPLTNERNPHHPKTGAVLSHGYLANGACVQWYQGRWIDVTNIG